MIKKSFLLGTLIFLISGALIGCSTKDDLNLAQNQTTKISAEDQLSAEATVTIQKEVFNLVNAHRKSIGKSLLKWDAEIAKMAQTHSKYQADQNRVSHDGWDQRSKTIFDNFNATQVGENCCSNSNAANAVAKWLTSSDHKANIEGDYKFTGVGAVKDGTTYYFTQIFYK